jgi:hypothetical protein
MCSYKIIEGTIIYYWKICVIDLLMIYFVNIKKFEDCANNKRKRKMSISYMFSLL